MMIAEGAIDEQGNRHHRECHECGNNMTGFEDEGYWECDHCGAHVRDHVSYSALTLFNKCPRQFYLRYLQDGIAPKMALRKSLGSQWHKWQHEYAEACRETGRARDLSAARALAAPYSDAVQKLADEFAANYVYRPEDWRGRGGSEIYRRVPLREDLPDFVARIDNLEYNSLDGRLTITDFKTPHANAYGDPDYPPNQLLWYAWAACESEKDLADEIHEVDMIRWIVPGSIQQTWTMYPPFPGAKSEIIRLAENTLEADEYPPTPSKNACAYCRYYHACEKAQEQEIDAPTSPEQGRKIFERYMAVDAYRKHLRGLLKDYVEENGSVKARGYEFGHHNPRWHERGHVRAKPSDTDAFLRACEEEGVDWRQFVARWNSKEIGKQFGEYLDPDTAPDGESPFGDDDEIVQQKSAVADTLESVDPRGTWTDRKIAETDEPEDEDE